MPHGPVLLSHDRFFKSFHREVIVKQPHLFKIDCLKKMKDLFPESSEPFYAGFGNRKTDFIAYKAMGMNEKKIFIIDP